MSSSWVAQKPQMSANWHLLGSQDAPLRAALKDVVRLSRALSLKGLILVSYKALEHLMRTSRDPSLERSPALESLQKAVMARHVPKANVI